MLVFVKQERKKLEELDLERQKAEDAMREAQDKLNAAEEASRRAAEEAKKKAREIKTCVGLARPLGPKAPVFVTHRGQGAFNELDFVKKEKLKEVLKEKEEQKLLEQQREGHEGSVKPEETAEDRVSDGQETTTETTRETVVNGKTDAEVSLSQEANRSGEVAEEREPTKPLKGEVTESDKTTLEGEVIHTDTAE